MADHIILKSGFGMVITVVTLVIAVLALVSLVIANDFESLIRYCWPLGLLGYGAWLLFWRPRVIVGEAGVTLVNVLRTIELPWWSIQRIDTKWALTLDTPWGRHTAWAAPAPSRYRATQTPEAELRHLPESSYSAGSLRPGDLPRTPSGDAAEVIRRQWEELRETGQLENAPSPSGPAPIRWDWPQVGILAALIAASVLGATIR